jgi:hypothetical protein
MRETEEFEPTPSRACNFCEFRLQCEDAYLSVVDGGGSPDERTDPVEEPDSPGDGLPFD